MSERQKADVYLRHGDPSHLEWKTTGKMRMRHFLWWSWLQCEETQVVYSPRKGWHSKTRWVRA